MRPVLIPKELNRRQQRKQRGKDIAQTELMSLTARELV
jgi:hypothetical protein